MPLVPKLNKFTTQSPLLASFDWIDLNEGTGFVKYFGYVTTTSAATDQHLGRNEVYSSVIETVGSTVGSDGVYIKSLDVDFDLSTFNIKQTLKGTMLVNGTHYSDRVTSSGNQYSYIIIKVRHWDGTTETEIANAQSKTIGGAGEEAELFSIPIVIPATSYAVGTTLRVTIEGWYQVNAAGNTGRVILGTDPKNRDGTYIVPSTDDPITTTKLEFYTPYKIQE